MVREHENYQIYALFIIVLSFLKEIFNEYEYCTLVGHNWRTERIKKFKIFLVISFLMRKLL